MVNGTIIERVGFDMANTFGSAIVIDETIVAALSGSQLTRVSNCQISSETSAGVNAAMTDAAIKILTVARGYVLIEGNNSWGRYLT